MRSFRRWAILPLLTLIIAAMVTVTMPLARADTVSSPGKLNYACALKASGLLRYASIPAECDYKGIGAAPSQHQPPVLAGIEAAALRYTADAPPIHVTASLTVTSPASATLAGATARISAGFVAGQDLLGFTSRSGITGSFKASSGVLTLTGSAPTAAYQAALRSVTYRDSDAAAPAGTRAISFQVSDGEPDHPLSNVVSRTVQVPPVKAPTVVNQSYNAVGNTPLGVGTTPKAPAATVSGSVLTGDSDPDPTATLSVTANTSPAHGTVTMKPNGTFTYLPNRGYSGTDSFQCTIAGSNSPSQTATATVTITVGTVVWYVSNSDTAAGNGEAATPFNTLAAANAVAGTNSVIFLYQGKTAYTGGVTMQPGEDLWGQPHGLTVGGYSLVSPGGSPPAVTNGGGDGIDLAEGADVENVNVTSPSGNGIVLAEGADVEGVNVNSPSGNGIAASNVSDATVGATTPVAISGAGGDGISIAGGDGNLNFGATSLTGSAGDAVSVASRSGGAVTFGGPITGTGGGVSLTNNAGATIAFTGTLTLSTDVAAFTATGGGMVTATGTGSTLTSLIQTVLTIQNTTIGAAGLTFQSVSSNGSYSNGIDLDNTGSSGGLTVTGTGTPGSGGTIQNSLEAGIQLTSTYAPSFTDMVIENIADDGISGSQVKGLTLAGSTVSGGSGDGLDFAENGTGSPDGLTGIASISNSTIAAGFGGYSAIISDTSGTLDLTVTGATFSGINNFVGLNINADGTTNATVSVTGSTFNYNDPDNALVFATATGSTGTNSITFSGNTLSGNQPIRQLAHRDHHRRQ